MDVRLGDLYEYTGETGFDLVQNNTYPIINIGKNKDITIKTDNGRKIFSWENFITIFEPVILRDCNPSVKAGDTIKCIKSLAYFDEGCTYTVLGVSASGKIVIRDKFDNSKFIESYEFNTYFTTTFQVTQDKEDVRSYNVGQSDYSKHEIQPWDIWLEYKLNPWDADIVKRILRTKSTDSRKLDYEKIIHICKERIRQIELGLE